MGEKEVTKTKVDYFLELVNQRKEISYKDAAKELNVSTEIIGSWADTLEERGKLSIEYKVATPYIVSIGLKGEEKKQFEKAKFKESLRHFGFHRGSGAEVKHETSSKEGTKNNSIPDFKKSEEKPKKLSFFQRLFGKKKEEPKDMPKTEIKKPLIKKNLIPKKSKIKSIEDISKPKKSLFKKKEETSLEEKPKKESFFHHLFGKKKEPEVKNLESQVKEVAPVVPKKSFFKKQTITDKLKQKLETADKRIQDETIKENYKKLIELLISNYSLIKDKNFDQLIRNYRVAYSLLTKDLTAHLANKESKVKDEIMYFGTLVILYEEIETLKKIDKSNVQFLEKEMNKIKEKEKFLMTRPEFKDAVKYIMDKLKEVHNA